MTRTMLCIAVALLPACTPAAVGQIRLHSSLPAFGNCSLDGNPGDGAFDPGGGRAT